MNLRSDELGPWWPTRPLPPLNVMNILCCLQKMELRIIHIAARQTCQKRLPVPSHNWNGTEDYSSLVLLIRAKWNLFSRHSSLLPLGGFLLRLCSNLQWFSIHRERLARWSEINLGVLNWWGVFGWFGNPSVHLAKHLDNFNGHVTIPSST